MNLELIRSIRRVKSLRADRAEEELRWRRAALAAQIAAVAEAQRLLVEWRADIPRRQAAIYDTVIGHIVDVEDLDAVKVQVIALREHEQVLQERLGEAQRSVREAEAAVQAAEAAAQEARRNLAKFDDLIDGLQRAEALLSERREDAELEEASEGRDGAAGGSAHGFDQDLDGIAGGQYEWDQAAG
jgi:type III secretion protein O